MSGGATFPPGVPVFRLVPRPPRPRRLEIRFHVLDRRAPYGRAGPFEIEELIAIAARMERRS